LLKTPSSAIRPGLSAVPLFDTIDPAPSLVMVLAASVPPALLIWAPPLLLTVPAMIAVPPLLLVKFAPAPLLVSAAVLNPAVPVPFELSRRPLFVTSPPTLVVPVLLKYDAPALFSNVAATITAPPAFLNPVVEELSITSAPNAPVLFTSAAVVVVNKPANS